jgi:hypothetical protein
MNRGYTFWGMCKGVTKAGTACKRQIVYANGYCQAHGGDSSKFMRERLEKIRAKAIRRARRWQRKMQKLLRTAEASAGK